jgi:selenocysteine lyase/cysteine desulfurase
LYASGPGRFEDGTLPFLSLPDIAAALDWHRQVCAPGIAAHTAGLTSRLPAGLRSLRHRGGEPAVRVHGPAATERCGPTVAFNLLDDRGRLIDERVLGAAAARAGISVRTGCFCNPGVGEAINAMSPAVVRAALRRGEPSDVDGYLRLLDVRAQGAVRASVGVANTAADVDRLLEVTAQTATPVRPPPCEPATAADLVVRRPSVYVPPGSAPLEGSELAQQPELVLETPALRDLAVHDTEHRHTAHGHLLAGGG